MQPQVILVPPSALNANYKKVWRGVDVLYDTNHSNLTIGFLAPFSTLNWDGVAPT